MVIHKRDVAQPGSAPALGAGSRRFKSSHPDQIGDYMTNEEREKLMSALLKSEEIKDIYEDYIVKEIPFEAWVRDTAGRLLKGYKI